MAPSGFDEKGRVVVITAEEQINELYARQILWLYVLLPNIPPDSHCLW
jgi:hypothetical protein